MDTVAQLLPQHLAQLQASAISPDVAREGGYRSLTDRREMLALGFKDYQARAPGLLIPLYDVDGNPAGYHYWPVPPTPRPTAEEIARALAHKDMQVCKQWEAMP